MWEGLGRDTAARGGSARPFRIVVVDEWPSTKSTRASEHLLEVMSNGPLLKLSELAAHAAPNDRASNGNQKQQQQQQGLVCFEEAYVGINKASTWYQYGFDKPQGPVLPHARRKGKFVRQASNYLGRRLAEERDASSKIAADRINTGHQARLPTPFAGANNNDPGPGAAADNTPDGGANSNVNSTVYEGAQGGRRRLQQHAHPHIVLFSRTRNRLLLNEHDLCSMLEATFGKAVTILRMETHDLEAQIEVLQDTDVAIGLHGSALVMAMFLPPGATLVELFPYGINPDNYTPYKTMAELDGMGIRYLRWVNTDEAGSVAHPDRSANLGGITHLPAAEQARIRASGVPVHLCCSSPYWLYRIYQDTVVDIAAIVALLSAPPPAPTHNGAAGGQRQHTQRQQQQQHIMPVGKKGHKNDDHHTNHRRTGHGHLIASAVAAAAAAAAAPMADTLDITTPGKVSAIQCKTQHAGTKEAPIWQLRITFEPPWNGNWLQQPLTYEVFGQELGIAWQSLDPELILEGDEVFALPSHTFWIRAKIQVPAPSTPGVYAGPRLAVGVDDGPLALYGQYAPAHACKLW